MPNPITTPDERAQLLAAAKLLAEIGHRVAHAAGHPQADALAPLLLVPLTSARAGVLLSTLATVDERGEEVPGVSASISEHLNTILAGCPICSALLKAQAEARRKGH